MSSLRRILASWVYAHITNSLDNDVDIEQNRVDLAVPRPGDEMWKFYTYLLRIEHILTDKVHGGRFEQVVTEDLHFQIPTEDLDKPITWKHLKTLCRLLHFFNSMKHDTAFTSALNKHIPFVVSNLDTLEKTEPTYVSLLVALQLSGSLRDTVTVFNALDQLMHRLLGTDDPIVNSLFKLDKRQSYVFVNGVLDFARRLFEPILQYLPASDKKSLTIIELVSERLPESLLQQTLWNNLETSPLNEVGSSDVRRLRASKQEQGSLCWEFITGLISQEYSDDVLTDDVFKKNELRNLKSLLNASAVHGEKAGDDHANTDEEKRVFKLSMYSISALLLLSSKTMVHCQCAAKTTQFISLIFSSCDEMKLKARSLVNSKLLVFAAHEVAKFPMVRPTERFNFRNIFITYRQADIFERSAGNVFQHKYLNELNFVRMLETSGLEPTYEVLIHLLLTLKNDPSVVLSDFLYTQLLNAILHSFGFRQMAIDWNDPEVIETYRTKSNNNPLLRLHGTSAFKAINIFCLSYVQKMAYFAQRVVISATQLIPLIHLIDFNARKKEYPITSAMLEMYIRHLPGEHTNSANLTSTSVDNQHLGARTLFKYLSLVVNVMIMEQTNGQYTMVDFIEQSGEISLY